MKSESEIQQLIQLEAKKMDCLLMRNNSGSLQDKDGRHVRFGLGNVSSKQNKIIKSSDLIGIRTKVITKEMVGMHLGFFTAVECKPEGWKYSGTEREEAQNNFLNLVRLHGGFAGFASSPTDLKKILF